MTVFVDTSALFAILDADDNNHLAVKDLWTHMLAGEEDLVVSNYVLVETFALVQHRLGMEAVKTLHEDIVPILVIEWIDTFQHASAISKLLARFARQISLVDWTSFTVMQRLHIKTAFAFDQDFRMQGFETVPA